MRKTLQITVLILALMLLAFAAPAIGAEQSLDSGDTLINGSILATEDTPQETVDMIEDVYPAPPAPSKNFGGSLNIDD